MNKKKVKKKARKKRITRKQKLLKEKKNSNKIYFFLTLILLVFVIDRITKLISYTVYGCFVFCMNFTKNYGAAFNLLSNFEFTKYLLIGFAIAVLAFTAFFYFRIKKMSYVHIGLALLFGGTLANLNDRIFYGYVIDFLTLKFIPFPSFNIADMANLAGVIILVIYLLRKN